jgi:hypothetical protein
MTTCRSCGAPIEWTRSPLGRPQPVDIGAAPDGNLIVAQGKSRPATDADRKVGLPLRRSHFSTCPHGAEWRKRQRPESPP